MSAEYYFNHCQKHINRPVEITTHEGIVHRGIVHGVDRTHVYLRPFDNMAAGNQGPGLFAWGAFAGGLLGGFTGVALGSIAAFRPYGGFGYGGFY
ncbi:hypothetical protein JOD43_002514 [Pullulanibacillus pueri]|uniref:Uncharacterized protein n=1 Tax=Pullulanibacillus pueri TaxID=1437324 RepID=A0A8J3ELF2_9BACL|nr:hypothetical protein [Pullulanibacillus pueri]MBM7682339.1 hypothetical protein [Pullulanibacillus pueri]GGH80738.1 hypothetical protein GCM10007096_17590 [Pullulanibacillus pueri]